jgi:riboflavin kinase/FMN adenylyltransferase
MKLLRNFSSNHTFPLGSVATIGNFDGVHLGHQEVLRQLAKHAKILQLPTVVIIFEPQPQEFFAPQQVPARLTRLREKLTAMQRYGVDYVSCWHFNAKFAALPAEDFINQILVNFLRIKHLVVGDDFRFGYKRQGNFALLQQASKHSNFTIENQKTFLLHNSRVSSTRIRQALEAGDMAMAKELLGRPYTLCGKVRYGQQLGRTIGFPTANIFLHRRVAPLSGVFAVYLHGVAKHPLPGVANLGTRPTFNGEQLLLEVHLFDFTSDIYGHTVEIEFVRKLRSEQHFASVAALKQQIALDVQTAQAVL